jgi:hypothetical protein
MLSALETLWRLLDFLSSLWDMVANWRIVICIAVAVGALLAVRQLGGGIGDDAIFIAGLVGLLAGLAWELVRWATRGGYV